MSLHETNPYTTVDDDLSDLSAKWQTRFRFFRAHGAPGMGKVDRDYQAAFTALPFRQRMLISFNGFAFFFGVFYLAYLGMWRKAVTFLGVGVAVGVLVLVLDLPNALDTGITFGLCGYIAARANTLYYDHRVLGRRTWGL